MVNDLKTKKIIALIAYLQRLGMDVKNMDAAKDDAKLEVETPAKKDTVANPAQVINE